MKNILLLFTIAAFFASSCSSKIGIAKRKYGKGYYVSVSHKPKAELEVSKLIPTNKTKIANEAVTVVRVEKSENTVSTQKVESKTIQPTLLKENSLSKLSSSKNHETLSANASSKLTSSKNIEVKSLPLNKLTKANKADDLNLIVMVILCIFPFINLIPVYLHQNKQITTDFWVTLILDFTWILGVVFSLLVVLDVFTLA